MDVLRAIRDKYQEEGFLPLLGAIYRNVLRRTVIGDCVRAVSSDIFIEKLVMTPRLGYWPNIRNPRSFNEKIAHRKFFTDKDIFAKITDKHTVREYVRTRADGKILNKVYHITDDPETIPFDALPNEFVIKTGNSGVIIVDDKSKINEDAIKSECREALAEPHPPWLHEYWYAECDPKIIIEKRLHGRDHDIPIDYKFYVFHGRVEYVHVDIDRFGEHSMRFYDRNWTPQDFIKSGNTLGQPVKKPDQYKKMVDIAEQLGKEFDFIRVDLYYTDEGIVFGEMTPAPASGTGGFKPKEVDFEFGSMW